MIKKLAGTVLTTGAMLAFAAPAAEAAPPEPFTIHETIDFSSDEPPTFTATGALCPSGTFEDEVIAGGGVRSDNGKVNFLIRTVYTCDNGDTFFALKQVHITETGEETSTNTGPIILQGGTGAFSRLSGHGVDEGTANGPSGVGDISGVLKLR